MSLFEAIILGLVQGITEFLPISSSGHLVIAGHLMGSSDAFAFDILLNFGSLAALIVYYRKRIYSIIIDILKNKNFTLALKIITATIPAVIIGLSFNQIIENLNSEIWVVIFSLVVIGILMILFGKNNPDADNREINESISWKIALRLGLVQSLALIPGTSRSGITILTGVNNKLSAQRATEFSFLMAIPIIAGATLKTLISSEGLLVINNNLSAFVVGNIVCFASGILAVSFLVKLLNKRGLRDFGWYRIALASLLSLLILTGVI